MKLELWKQYDRPDKQQNILVVSPMSREDVHKVYGEIHEEHATLVVVSPEWEDDSIQHFADIDKPVIFYLEMEVPDNLEQLQNLITNKNYPPNLINCVNSVYYLERPVPETNLVA